MSSLDIIILQVAFLILAFEVTLDAKEHDVANYMRKHLLPWFSDSDKIIAALKRCDGFCCDALSIRRVLVSLVAKIVDVACRRIVPALLPATMNVLLVSTGTTSTSIILNGLSLAFVYQMVRPTVPAVPAKPAWRRTVPALLWLTVAMMICSGAWCRTMSL